MITRNHTLATLAVVAWVHSFREAAKSLTTWAEKKGLADMYLDVDHVMQLLTAMGLQGVPVLAEEGCLPDPIEGLVKAHYMVLTEFRADDISPIAYFMLTLASTNGDPLFVTSHPNARVEHRRDDLYRKLTGRFVVLADPVDVRAIMASRGVQLG